MAFPIINLDLFRALTEFKDTTKYPDETVELISGEAANLMSEAKFGDKADLALVYLTAHMLKKSTPGGAGATGPLTMEKVGDLARSYGTIHSTTSSSDYDTTSYGQSFRGIIQRLATIRPFHVGC